MSSVEWGTSSELTTGGDSRSGRLSRNLADRLSRLTDMRARRIAAAGLLVTFLLVAVSQWVPWFSLDASSTGEDFGLSGGVHTVSAITALGGLATAYFLGWTLIAVVSAAAVFGRRRVRRTAAGITAGAIAGQAFVVMSVWHDNGIGVFRSVLGEAGGVRGHREIGLYLTASALLVSAAAMVVVVRGRVLPTLNDDDDDASDGGAIVPDTPAPASDHDDDFQSRQPRLGAPVVESAEALGDRAYDEINSDSTPDLHRELPDHSMFMRPRGADARR
jgi:hypothetical protein